MCIVNKRPQPKYLLFKDLSKKKYFKVQRYSGLDEIHLKLTLEKLAKFHACTAFMYHQNRELFSNHQQPNVSEYLKIFHPMFIKSVERIIDTVSKQNWKNSNRIVEKLKEFKINMIDKVSEAFMINEHEMGVLNHGDLWIDNLFFRYDKQKNPIDVKMVRNKIT